MRNGVSSLWDFEPHEALDGEDGNSGFGHTGDVFDCHEVRPNLDDLVAEYRQAIVERADLVATSDILQVDRLAFLQDGEKALLWIVWRLAGHSSDTNRNECGQ